MLKEVVAPALRRHNFKGSGGEYLLPDAGAWALVGFQRSDVSSAQAVKFTINLKVVSRSTWDDARHEQTWLPERPKANSRYPVGEWSERIGKLMPDGEDHWWWVRPDDDPSQVGAEVVTALARPLHAAI